MLTVTADGVVSLSPDLNGDNVVDSLDLAILLSDWGQYGVPSDFYLSGEVAAARELRDRYLEQVNTGQLLPGDSEAAKYDVSRALEAASGETPMATPLLQ